MPVQKTARFALVALVTLVAFPAATAHAATRMPIGFFDDSSFRFSPAREENLTAAAAHRSLRHPHDCQLGDDRGDQAREPVERQRPGLRSSVISTSSSSRRDSTVCA